ncbi:MAG: hypothetical protein LBC92_03750 [Rickettsiales bacterium]|jgi:hypothetical protein|nr:hypothetical protein [Rickettsiales bacterium]
MFKEQLELRKKDGKISSLSAEKAMEAIEKMEKESYVVTEIKRMIEREKREVDGRQRGVSGRQRGVVLEKSKE